MSIIAIGIIVLLVFLTKGKSLFTNADEIIIASLPIGEGKLCSQYASFILTASITFGVPAKIMDAMIFVESSDGRNTNHSSGEIGVMAVKPLTASDVKKRYPKLQNANLEYPHDNIAIAAGYLHMCYDVWGNWNSAVVAYNSGIRNPIAKQWQTNGYYKLIYDRMKVQC